MKSLVRKLLYSTTLLLATQCALHEHSSLGGLLTRNRYDFSLDAQGARTTSYRVFLTNYVGFPSAVTGVDMLESGATTTRNSGDDYGSLIQGYIYIPEDGDYAFTIGSDDSSALWISTNHMAPLDFPAASITAARLPDAEETGYSSQGLFGAERLAERTTETRRYRKGDYLYFEMLSQEGDGGDFMDIGWTRPNGAREIIPSGNLLPWTPAGTALELANNQVHHTGLAAYPVSGPNDTNVNELSPVDFEVDVFGGVKPLSFQWRQNGSDIPGATLPHYYVPAATLSLNGARFSCVVRDANNATVTSREAVLNVQADTTRPTILGAAGSGNPQGIIVTFSEAIDPGSATNIANYALTGQSVTIQEASMLQANQVLLKVTEFNTDPMTLTINNVTDVSAARNVILANSTTGIRARSTLGGYWSFDEGSGSVTRDKADANSGVLMNSPTWVADVPTLGRANPFALSFDGVDDFVQTAYRGVGGGNPRTVSFWMKTTAENVNLGLVAWGNSTANSLKYHVRMEQTTGTIRTEVQGGNKWTTKVVNDGVWHHVVSMLPALEAPMNLDVQHYVDGELDPQLGGANIAVNTDITSANALPVEIGSRNQVGTRNFFPGLMDEVAIFEGELTPEQIAQLAAGADPHQFAQTLATPLTFAQQPTNQSVLQLRPVTFHAAVAGSTPSLIGYQWYRDGQLIPGATQSSYSLEMVDLLDDGVTFRVDAFNQDGTFSRISSAAALSVISDFAPPVVLSVRGVPQPINRVEIQFNEPLDEITATDTSNYTIAGLTVSSASLSADGMTVTLTTSAQTLDATYQLNLQNINDRSGGENFLNMQVEFAAKLNYTDLVLYDNPVAYWRFNETSGTVATNSVNPAWNGVLNSGNSGQLPVQGALGLVPNVADSAYAFVASQGNRVLIPDNPAFNTGGGPYRQKTIEFWFKASSLPTRPEGGMPSRMFLFEQGGTTRGISIYLSGTQPANPTSAEIHFKAWNDNADGVGSPWGGPESEGKIPSVVIGTVELDKVYHAVMVMDGDTNLLGTLSGYLNGVPAGPAATGIGLLYNAGDDGGIGAINQNSVVKEDNRGVAYGDPFNGIIDEFAYYTTALSAAQVKAHYEQGVSPGPLPSIVSLSPPTGATFVAAESGIEFILEDQQTSVNTNTITMYVNDLEVTPSITRAGLRTTIRYVAPTYPSSAAMNVRVEWANNEGVSGHYAWSFQTIPILPAAWAAPVGSGTNPGFRVRSVQADSTLSLANTVARAEDQLKVPPVPDAVYTASTNLDVINLSLDDGIDNGYFTYLNLNGGFDYGFGSYGLIDYLTTLNQNNFSVEVLAYLELQPGVVHMGVNSDDGFRVTVGRLLGENSLELGIHNAGRGITAGDPQSALAFQVSEAGVYAFRLVYFQGTGDLGLEWSIKDSSGVSHLLNSSTSPVKAYQNRTQDPPALAEPAVLAGSVAGSQFTLSFGTQVGASYDIQSTDSLANPSWTTTQTVTGDGNPASVTESITGKIEKYFRVMSK